MNRPLNPIFAVFALSFSTLTPAFAEVVNPVYSAYIEEAAHLAPNHTELSEYVGGEVTLTEKHITLTAAQSLESTAFKITHRETDEQDRVIIYGIQIPTAESDVNSPMPRIQLRNSHADLQIVYSTETLEKGQPPRNESSTLIGQGFILK